MQQVINAEKTVRDLIRARTKGLTGQEARREAEIIAGDVAAQVYHYLTAVAHAELCVQRAKVGA